MQQSAKAK